MATSSLAHLGDFSVTETKAGRAAASRNVARGWQVGLAATLMLAASPAALHAEVSNAELAKEIAELKAQIRSLKGGVAEVRSEARRKKVVVAAPAAAYVPPPAFAAIPPGATPVFATADKKLQFGSLTITPGGFVAMEGIYRTRDEGADIASSFANLPFGPQAAIPEQRFTARQSRVALLIESPISKSNVVAGYGEFDFQGSAVTSNSGETNSYVPRVRHLYATLDNSDYGLHVLAGQTFSLATLNSKGITPRNEALPPSIDGQYVVGFNWRRDPQIRLTKDFNKKLWLSISAETSQTSFGGTAPGAGANATTLATGPTVTGLNFPVAGGGNLNFNQTYSFNQVPDIIGKAAYEARIGERDIHIEALGMYRQFLDRDAVGAAAGGVVGAETSASNRVAHGWGVGGGLLVPVLPQRLDFQVSGLRGRGSGTYGSGQLNDATLNPEGSVKPLREQTLLAGIIAHVTPSIDVYGFAGVEQIQASFNRTAAGVPQIGYGLPNANNSQCFDTVNATASASVLGSGTANNNLPGGTCSGNTKRLWEITGGVWDKLYKGSFGEVRVGVQYEFIRRELFQGNGATPGFGALNFSPHQNDNVILTSLRYYPFQ